jgi:uncharacterized membrane protein
MNELNTFCFVTNIVVIIICGVIFAITPMLTRKPYLFGVKVPPEASTDLDAIAIKKRYVALCIAGTVSMIVISIMQYLSAPDLTMVSMLYYPLVLVVIQFTIFIMSWKGSLILKAKNGWVVNDLIFAETKSSHSRGKLSELPWVWYILSLVIIFATVLLALTGYPNLPDQIPTHYDFNMQPDAWVDKSLWAVMSLPVMNLATLLIMWLSGFMFVRAKLQIDPQKPALSFAQHRIYRRRMGHSIGFLAVGIVVLFAWIGLMPVFEGLTMSMGLTLAIPIVASIPLMIVPVISGQGGGKIKLDIKEAQDTDDPDSLPIQTATELKSSDDKFWKLGTFYCNPDDPACIVEDRFGFNLGFNYSRIQVKIGITALLLSLIALYAWVTPLLLTI